MTCQTTPHTEVGYISCILYLNQIHNNPVSCLGMLMKRHLVTAPSTHVNSVQLLPEVFVRQKILFLEKSKSFLNITFTRHLTTSCFITATVFCFLCWKCYLNLTQILLYKLYKICIFRAGLQGGPSGPDPAGNRWLRSQTQNFLKVENFLTRPAHDHSMISLVPLKQCT